MQVGCCGVLVERDRIAAMGSKFKLKERQQHVNSRDTAIFEGYNRSGTKSVLQPSCSLAAVTWRSQPSPCLALISGSSSTAADAHPVSFLASEDSSLLEIWVWNKLLPAQRQVNCWLSKSLEYVRIWVVIVYIETMLHVQCLLSPSFGG